MHSDGLRIGIQRRLQRQFDGRSAKEQAAEHGAEDDALQRTDTQARFVFHPPRLNTAALTMASVEKAIVIATYTPGGPSSNCSANSQARGISQNHKHPRLIHIGVHVSP